MYEETFSTEIDKMKLRNFLFKVPIQDYVNISKSVYQNFSKEAESSLLIKSYNAMLVRLEDYIFIIFVIFCYVVVWPLIVW